MMRDSKNFPRTNPNRKKACFTRCLLIGVVFAFIILLWSLSTEEDGWVQTAVELPENSFLKSESRAIEDDLANRVRLLCFVITSPATHRSKADHVKATWGRRCNILLFMSSQNDTELPTVALPLAKDDRDHLWAKTRESLKYIHANYRDKADWFVKADDDTYMIIENLRFFLKYYDTNTARFFGHRFKRPETYMSGGAGYVLSKESLNRFIAGYKQHTDCRRYDYGAEDLELGRCLRALGVLGSSTRDVDGGERFIPTSLGRFIDPEALAELPWYANMTYYPRKDGEKCISRSAISFHYTAPGEMHLYEYLLYRIAPYGVKPWFEDNREFMVNSN